MAFKMKGSPMARNFGIGESAMKHPDPDQTDLAKKHSHGDSNPKWPGETHNAAGEAVADPADAKGAITTYTDNPSGKASHDPKHGYNEGTPKKHTHGKNAVTEDTTDEEREAIRNKIRQEEADKKA